MEGVSCTSRPVSRRSGARILTLNISTGIGSHSLEMARQPGNGAREVIFLTICNLRAADSPIHGNFMGYDGRDTGYIRLTIELRYTFNYSTCGYNFESAPGAVASSGLSALFMSHMVWSPIESPSKAKHGPTPIQFPTRQQLIHSKLSNNAPTYLL